MVSTDFAVLVSSPSVLRYQLASSPCVRPYSCAPISTLPPASLNSALPEASSALTTSISFLVGLEPAARTSMVIMPSAEPVIFNRSASVPSVCKTTTAEPSEIRSVIVTVLAAKGPGRRRSSRPPVCSRRLLTAALPAKCRTEPSATVFLPPKKLSA